MPPEWVLSNLENKRVKISQYWHGGLNDPFELSVWDMRDAALRHKNKEMVEDFSKKIGLICLSKLCSSPAMWAHYTQNHTGVCFELEVEYDHLVDVKYIRNKQFSSVSLATIRSKINRSNIQKVLAHKSTEWRYERETRLHVPLKNKVVDEDNGKYFLPFQEEKDNTFLLKKILVGYRCKLGTALLEKAVSKYSHKVKVQQMRPAFGRFSVVPQNDKKFWNTECQWDFDKNKAIDESLTPSEIAWWG
jgi:hypothetical protein